MLNAPCIGPLSVKREFGAVFPSLFDEKCPFGMTLSLDTALLVPHLRTKLPNSLFYCFKLSPRCLHCDVMKASMASGRSGIFVFSTIQTDKRFCRAKDCQRSSWRDLGIYCDMHYMMIPHFINLASGRPNGPPKMSKSLIGNLDGLRLQHEMAHRNFMCQNSDLAEILLAITDPNPNAPSLYALDTEFYQPRMGGALKITEVAFVNIKTGQIAVNVSFDDDHRAMNASRKLGPWGLGKKSSTAKHVHQVRNANEMVEQLEDCQFGPNDKIVEYSMHSHSLLDMKNVHLLLEQCGYESQGLLSTSKGYALIKPIQKLLGQAIKLKSWSQPVLFRILFPQDPLVDQNHSAVVDAIQLAQILRLSAELFKSPAERQLPEGLLRGFEKLVWLDKNSVPSNTLDQYFEAVGQVDSQKYVGLFEEEVRQEETDDEADKSSEASGAYGIVESQIAQQISVSDPPGAHVHGMDGVPGEPVGDIVRHAEWHNTRCKSKRKVERSSVSPAYFNKT